MTQRIFKQGERVTWRDASGERHRGHVLQHSYGRNETGEEQVEQVLVMREGSTHVTTLPPAALVPFDG